MADDVITSNRIKVADSVIADDTLGMNILDRTGPDAGLFEIDGLALYLRAGVVRDHAPNPVLDVTVTVDDASAGTRPDATTAPAITVVVVNDAPVLDPIDDHAVDALTALSFSASASDQDLPPDTLTFSLDAASLAAGMTIDAASGAFAWPPTAAQAGADYRVTITVTDNRTPNLTDGETFTITVGHRDIQLVAATAAGGTTLDVTYALSSLARPAFDLGFFISANPLWDASDTLAGQVTLGDPADRTSGVHTKTYTIGTGAGEIALPGASVAETGDEYDVLVVADAAGLIVEEDADPVPDDNTAALTGVYHPAGGPVYVHGTDGADQIAVSAGRLQVVVNGSPLIYDLAATTGLRVRGHGGDAASVHFEPCRRGGTSQGGADAGPSFDDRLDDGSLHSSSRGRCGRSAGRSARVARGGREPGGDPGDRYGRGEGSGFQLDKKCVTTGPRVSATVH